MSRADLDKELWLKWTKDKDPEVLSALLTTMDPIIQKRVYQFRSAPIPDSAIEAEARKQAINAFKSFDPKKSQLNTHVTNHLQKVFRYVSKYQNIARIPESRTAKIDLYQKTKAYMSDMKDREPSTVELADELNWSVKEVGRMEKELRKDLGLETSFSGISFNNIDDNSDLLAYGYYELDPNEQIVFDYILGMHGKPKLRINQLAKVIKKTPRQIGLIKNKIAIKLKRFQ